MIHWVLLRDCLAALAERGASISARNDAHEAIANAVRSRKVLVRGRSGTFGTDESIDQRISACDEIDVLFSSSIKEKSKTANPYGSIIWTGVHVEMNSLESYLRTYGMLDERATGTRDRLKRQPNEPVWATGTRDLHMQLRAWLKRQPNEPVPTKASLREAINAGKHEELSRYYQTTKLSRRALDREWANAPCNWRASGRRPA